MTNLSAAPPFGATAPTDGADSTIWTQTPNFDKTLRTLISMDLEEQLREPLPYLLAGNYLTASLLKGSTNTLRYLAVGDLPVDVSDSSDLWVKIEGEPNDTEDLDFGFEEFSVKQGMRTIRLTDVARDLSALDLMGIVSEKVARLLMEIGNAIAVKTILTGTNVYRVGGGGSSASVGANDVITGAVIRDFVSEMDIQLIPRFGNQTFRGFLHPYVKVDLQADDDAGGFIDASRYAQPGKLLTGEVGQFGGVTFVRSVTGSKKADAGASSNDVFVTPIIGPGAFAIGDFGNINTYITPPGGHDDPGHQSALVTVIGYWGGMVVGEGTNASGPVSGPRYLLVESGSSKSAS